MDIDQFLMPEHSPAVQSDRDRVAKIVELGRLSGACGKSGKPMSGEVYVQRKRRLDDESCWSDWHPQYEEGLPTHLLLAERQKWMLDRMGARRWARCVPCVFPGAMSILASCCSLVQLDA